MNRRIVPLALSLCVAAPLFGAPARTTTKLADGVYEIQHPDALPDFPQGNTTVIIGDEAVFVVDSGYLPSTTRSDIAQIRKWTDKPVRYLMNTHGHTDHTTGNGIYAREFPGLTIVAHRETRNLMSRFSPGYVALFTTRTALMKKTLASGAGADGKPLAADAMEEMRNEITSREQITPDIATMGENALPNLVFDTGSMSFDLGHREVEVKFLGRGNTAGDVVAFLANEKIAIVGDVLVSPVPYTCSGFPVDWKTTLDNLAALSPETIVPGHGDVMHDLDYLRKVQVTGRSDSADDH